MNENEESGEIEVPKIAYNLDAMAGAFEEVKDPESDLPLPDRLVSKTATIR